MPALPPCATVLLDLPAHDETRHWLCAFNESSHRFCAVGGAGTRKTDGSNSVPTFGGACGLPGASDSCGRLLAQLKHVVAAVGLDTSEDRLSQDGANGVAGEARAREVH